MVKTESIDTAVQEVTNVLIAAADFSIPKSSSHSFQHYKPWWNAGCQTAYKNQRKLWGNLSQISHYGESLGVQNGKSKCSQSKASESEAILDPICVLTHFVNVRKQLWKKLRLLTGYIGNFSPTNLELTISSPVEIANILGETFQSVSRCSLL
ncbi:RNase H domain-containing protein [Trichonephila clavipes]|nr:RNase H domain-containing protein [Trichonephila clavipes]